MHSELGLHLTPHQYQVFTSPERFRVVVAGRRSGKTELAIAEILKATESPNCRACYICPSDKQAKQIMWERLKLATKHRWSQKPSETECRINLTNGSVIFVKGAFDPDSLRGVGFDFIVLDEVADLKPEAWPQVFRPCLADRQGRALFIGTPKGRDALYDHYERAKTTPDWAGFQFTTEEGGIVSKSELEAVAREIDSNVYRREFNAEFNVVGDYRVYQGFTYSANVREVSFEPSEPLIWALDFNVDPMCMLIIQRLGEIVHVLEEIIVRSNTNTTETACQAFVRQAAQYVKAANRFRGVLEVHAYGDASGNQRRTSASATDWTIIRNFFRTFHTGEIILSCRSANINPHVRDRINCVNARLRNHNGDSRLFIHPTCKELIRDLEEVCYTLDAINAPTSEINKSDRSRTHTSDALGYYISDIFPLRGTFNF